MIDAALRRYTGPPLARAGAALAGIGIRPGWLTAAGWTAGVGACAAAATRAWPAALVLWLANRVLDGLDGPVARAGTGPTEAGALLDIVADFSIYGGFVVAVAIAEPAARVACLALLLAYYVSGGAFLAMSSLLERRGVAPADDRSLRFVGGLAEGAETIAVYVLFCLLPGHVTVIAWAFTAAVAVTAVQRVWTGAACLSDAARCEGRTVGRSDRHRHPAPGWREVPEGFPELLWNTAERQAGFGVVTMRASWHGRVLAESDRTVVVEGNHYFPPDSLRREHLAATDSHSLCPWKGRASYFDVTVDGAVNPAAAWYYPKPWPLARKIRDHVAFWNGVSVEEVPDRP